MPPATPNSSSGVFSDQRATSPATGDKGTADKETVAVQVVELVDGRKLFHPIVNREGLLLLAAGATISSRFKELLHARGIQEVMLHASDAGAAVEKEDGGTPTVIPASGGVLLNSELTARLDALVDSGRLFAASTGPQFKGRLASHGCAAYNAEQRAQLLNQHAASCSTLDNMLKAAMHGEAVSGDEIATITVGYLSQFCLDADCVLEVANQAQSFVELAEQSLRTSLLAMALAIEMGMAEEDVRTIGLSGLLHDWGMTRISPNIRNATRLLSHAEFDEIQKHPLYTLEILERISGIPPQVPLICYQVHEQPDGRGYPRGRRNDEIHPGASILHVADIFSALTSPRPYRLALTPYAAVECLVRNAKEHTVDPLVVRNLLHVISLFPIGSYVVLNDTSMARVIRRNGNHFSAPIVQLVRRPDGSRIDTAEEILIVDTALDQRKIVRAMRTPGRQEISLRPELLRQRRT